MDYYLIITTNEWHTTPLLDFYVQKDRLTVVSKTPITMMVAKEANQPIQLIAQHHLHDTSLKLWIYCKSVCDVDLSLFGGQAIAKMHQILMTFIRMNFERHLRMDWVSFRKQ
eukprot:345442_1